MSKEDKRKKQDPENQEEPYLTTNQGVRINNTDDSLKAGSRGPTIMEDFHFREKMTHFDHERIPERVVHARGSAAHGYFQVYESMAKYTKAKFLQDPKVKTPVFVRFSTVVGFRGSADTVRDARGFATKFYTEDGNFDLVGNNMPVFFIQDGIKFPDLVHSIKPEPHNEMPQASAAHDNFWDFISLMPESMHMIMWVLSDRALPRSYSMMEGFGVHTFRLINDKGKSVFIKWHWKPVLGVHSLVWDEVQKIAGKDPDFNRKDMWESIEMGNPFEFELGIQVVDEKDEHKFGFDLLDPTKMIPEELVPVQKIGKMTLDRNPDNFFAETEQVAFHPGHVVPGIDFTNDPLLQGRLFSYIDTQLIRLGGPNFSEIPINRPLAPVNNNQRDGFMRQTINKGKTNYLPNSVGGGCPMHAPEKLSGYVHHAEKVEGNKIRERSESFKDHFSQATLFYKSMSPIEKKHITEAFHFELGKVESKDVRKRVVGLIMNIDMDLAKNVTAGIGIDMPKKPGNVDDKNRMHVYTNKKMKLTTSPALSMENTVKNSIKGRKVAVLLENGFNYNEFMEVKDAITSAGGQVKVVSKILGMKKADNGKKVETDKSHVTTGSIMFDAIFIPGGKKSIDAMVEQGDSVHFVNEAFKHCKPIGATSEGIDLLKVSHVSEVDVAKGSEIVSDLGVVTVAKNGKAKAYNQKFIDAIKQHRHWGRELNKLNFSVPA